LAKAEEVEVAAEPDRRKRSAFQAKRTALMKFLTF
jgi:hypothetical protein